MVIMLILNYEEGRMKRKISGFKEASKYDIMPV